MKELDDSITNIKETINRRGFVKVPVLEQQGEKEDNFRRVAKFLLLIGVEQASKVLQLLPEDQIERLMLEIASIRYVSPDEATVILAEFKALSVKNDAIGGVEKAKEILQATYGKQKAEVILQKVAPPPTDDYFSYLKELDAEKLSIVLKDESIPVKTLVLSKVTPEIAAAIINQLEKEEKHQVILRLAKMQSLDLEVIKRVDQSIKEKVLALGNTDSEVVDGRGALAEILKRMDLKSEGTILSAIEDTDPELSKNLHERLFTIEDVINADDRYIQKELQKMSDTDIAMLISDKDATFREKILSNVSQLRRTEILTQEEIIKPLLKSDVNAITNKFFAILRTAFENGDLFIKGRTEDLYVM